MQRESAEERKVFMKKRLHQGFTLLEMTIVVIIISVIFLLSVPSIKKTLGVVNTKGCKAMEKVADSAILQYKMEYDRYPGSTADLISAGLLTKDQVKCDGDRNLVISDGQAHIN